MRRGFGGSGLVSPTALALLLLTARAQAARPVMERLPNDKLEASASLLEHGDMALVESRPDGSMKQVSILMFVAAPPEVIHDVVGQPANYKKFIPNLSKSLWEAKPDGSGISTWQIDLPVSEFDATDEYRFEPGPFGSIVIAATDPHDDTNYRWDFLPVTGGTVVVQYGYTDVKHSNKFVRGFVARQATMEHGLALAAQLILARAFKIEAEKRTPKGSLPALDKSRKSPGFNFLLDRGQVVIMRSLPNGRLGDISVLDRMSAPPEKIIDALTHPAAYHSFIPGMDESYEAKRDGEGIEYRVVMAVPIVSWNTRYRMRATATQVEGVGIDGDLKGAHYLWELVPHAKDTLVIYRVNEPLTQSSLIVRTLVGREPSLEHGLGVAFGLVYMRAIRSKAEGWK